MPPKKQPTAPVGASKPEAPSIPLHCLLCPKRPTFSDVSHLLTHISSKSHLSNRFKAEIRSQKDKDARESLRQFDTWYERYGIQGLLADRMTAKDNKGAKRSRAQSPAPKPRSYHKREEMIKAEPESVSRQSSNGSLHAHSTRQDYGADDSPYQQRRSLRPRPLKQVSQRQVKSEPWADELDETENSFPDEESIVTAADEQIVTAPETADKSKLKGVLWPGMSLFDSATEDQKRKRNQRKDANVLRNMEQVAAGVEPTECIWSEDIDLQRTRDIYATPSVYGSPEPEVEDRAEPKKKRARRSTAAVKTGPKKGQGRQKRASIRPTRTKKAIKQADDADSVVNSDDREDVQETTPADDIESDEKLVSSSSTHSPDADYDIFRDPPTAGSGQTDPSLNAIKFEPGTRQALQPMSANIAMASPTPHASFKHLAQLRRGDSGPAVMSHSPSPTPFFSHSQGLGNGNFNNPLAFSQGASGLSYTNHFTGTFEEDAKPATSRFQPINTLPDGIHGLPFNAYAMPNGGNFYTGSATQTDTPNFEI